MLFDRNFQSVLMETYSICRLMLSKCSYVLVHGVYTVFYIGYAQVHGALLCFLQPVFLDVPADERNTVALTKFPHQFDTCMLEYKDKRKYKKTCCV